MVKKQKIKSTVYKIEVELLSRVVHHVLTRANKKVMLSSVRQYLGSLPLSKVEKNYLWEYSQAMYKHSIAAAGRKSEPEDRADAIYSVLRNDVKILEHQKNIIADEVEWRLKKQELVKNIEDSENKFFYCTEHKNPACGHAAYQGKIYYRRSEVYTAEERTYILRHKLMAVEDVVLEPIWLTTRKNCRHQLIPISFKTVQTGDYRVIREVRDISYEESQQQAYSDRLKMLRTIRNVFNSNGYVPDDVQVDIRRTWNLVRAWNQKTKKIGK